MKKNLFGLASGLAVIALVSGCASGPKHEAPAPAPTPKSYVIKGVNFEFDSAKLTADSTAALDDVLKILKRHEDLQVEIAGHTDSSGAEAYNQKLSERRAKAVRDYLVENGIDAARLSVKGYGESDPVADNASKEGRAKNRRVEMRHD